MSAQTVASDPSRPVHADAKAGSVFAIVKETVADWMEDNAMRLSAALSLYSILSLAPLLVLTIKVIGLIWRGGTTARDLIAAQMGSLMGSQAAAAVKPMLESGAKHGSGVLATVISTAVLIFSATGVFVELQDSMNTIWGVKPKPNQGIWGFVRNRLLSVGMVFGIVFLLLVSMFVSTMLAGFAKYVAGDTKWMAFLVDAAVSLVVVFLLFAAIFRFLPDVKIAWRHVWLGAAMTAVLFTVGKYGLTLYFKFASPTSAFGAAGSLAAVLLWVYYSSFILFFGAEFTKVWALHHGHHVVPDEHAVKVTEEERAQKGIPSDRRMDEALGREAPAAPAGARGARSAAPGAAAPVGPATATRGDGLPATAAWAAAAVVGGLGAGYFLGRSRGRGAGVPPDPERLNERLRAIDEEIVRVTRPTNPRPRRRPWWFAPAVTGPSTRRR